MRIHTKCISFKNCWIISSCYDFQAHWQCSQRKCCFSQTVPLWFEVLPDTSQGLPGYLSALPGLQLVLPGLWSALQACCRCCQVLPGAPKVLSGTPKCSQTYHNHSDGSPVPVIRDPSYSETQLECPPSVWYSPEIDSSRFTLHVLSDTPGGSQWLT